MAFQNKAKSIMADVPIPGYVSRSKTNFISWNKFKANIYARKSTS